MRREHSPHELEPPRPPRTQFGVSRDHILPRFACFGPVFARAPGVRWAYFLRLNIRVLIFLLSGLVLSRLFRTNLTVTVGYYGDRCAAAPRAESSPKLSGQGGLGGTSTTKVGPAWATRQNIIFVVSGVLELHSPLSIDPGSVTLCCPWYYAVLAL